MAEALPFANIVEDICMKLHCSHVSEDMERIVCAKENLGKLQQEEAISAYVSNTEKDGEASNLSDVLETPEKTEEAEGDFSDDAWLGYFKGFEIVTADEELIINETKQCREICPNTSDYKLDFYVRCGIRCFMIDLFKGTELEKQKIIYQLRESELRISYEYGFPISASVFAMISPRCQYLGMLKNPLEEIKLEKDDKITLSTTREFSTKGNAKKVFVNARFLLEDCRIGDFLLVGQDVQLKIDEIKDEDLNCVVMKAGYIRSRMPVRFPARCDRYSTSLEELEDITCARELGINVLISYTPGTPEYLDDLENTIRLLNCDKMWLGCRLILNEINDDSADLQWITERYDCFVVGLSYQQHHETCSGDMEPLQPREQQLLMLTPKAVKLLHTIYELKKPIIMEPSLINEELLCVHPSNNAEIFFCPDRYMFTSDYKLDTFNFNLLQAAHFNDLKNNKLSALPYCDQSHTGSDSIARSCVAASYESNANAILVCSTIPDMSIKLSHYRPQCPIICITEYKSTGTYISMYHNIIQLYMNKENFTGNHKDFVTRCLIFGLAFLKGRKMVLNNQNIIMVYGTEEDTTLPDNYLVYKFNEPIYLNNLREIIFQ